MAAGSCSVTAVSSSSLIAVARLLLVALAAPSLSGSPMTPTPMTGAAQQQACGCAEFCAGRCAFNATGPQTLNLFRRTPASDVRLANHDTGSSVGDAEFALYSFSYAYQCRTGGSPRDCSFLQNDTVYAQFEVEINGRFGPYLACNPNTSTPAPHNFHCGVHSGPPEWSGCRKQWQVLLFNILPSDSL